MTSLMNQLCQSSSAIVMGGRATGLSRPSPESGFWGPSPVGSCCNQETTSFVQLMSGVSCRIRKGKESGRHTGVRAFTEPSSNPIFNFFNKLQGSLPIVGLLARIMSDTGGIGTDRIQFVEFCTRVQRASSVETSRALYKLGTKHGKVAGPQYVLIWCWAAALGAGLLRSNDLMLAASRLRVSYDIQYELENMELLMDEATKKRGQSPPPDVPMAARAEKAYEAICTCCIGTLDIDQEDRTFLVTILSSVFPTVDKDTMNTIVCARSLYAARTDSTIFGSDSEPDSKNLADQK